MTDTTTARPEPGLDILIFLKPDLAGWLFARLSARGLRATIVETAEALGTAAASGRPAMAVTTLAHIDTVRAAGNLPVVNFDVFLHLRDDGAGGRKRVFDAAQFFRRIEAIAARRFSVPSVPLPEPRPAATRVPTRLRRLARLAAGVFRHRPARLAAIRSLCQARDDGARHAVRRTMFPRAWPFRLPCGGG